MEWRKTLATRCREARVCSPSPVGCNEEFSHLLRRLRRNKFDKWSNVYFRRCTMHSILSYDSTLFYCFASRKAGLSFRFPSIIARYMADQQTYFHGTPLAASNIPRTTGSHWSKQKFTGSGYYVVRQIIQPLQETVTSPDNHVSVGGDSSWSLLLALS